jgi:hypothetical protein
MSCAKESVTRNLSLRHYPQPKDVRQLLCELYSLKADGSIFEGRNDRIFPILGIELIVLKLGA